MRVISGHSWRRPWGALGRHWASTSHLSWKHIASQPLLLRAPASWLFPLSSSPKPYRGRSSTSPTASSPGQVTMLGILCPSSHGDWRCLMPLAGCTVGTREPDLARRNQSRRGRPCQQWAGGTRTTSSTVSATGPTRPQPPRHPTHHHPGGTRPVDRAGGGADAFFTATGPGWSNSTNEPKKCGML